MGSGRPPLCENVTDRQSLDMLLEALYGTDAPKRAQAETIANALALRILREQWGFVERVAAVLFVGQELDCNSIQELISEILSNLYRHMLSQFPPTVKV